MIFFPFFKKKMGFWVFMVHPTVVSLLLSASVERFFFYRMRDFFKNSMKKEKNAYVRILLANAFFSSSAAFLRLCHQYGNQHEHLSSHLATVVSSSLSHIRKLPYSPFWRSQDGAASKLE